MRDSCKLSFPLPFAARSRVLARLASLAQIGLGELARRLTLKMTTALSTSLFRTTFTWTIILNLLMKRLLGSNLSHFWNHYQRKEKHFGLNSLFVSTVANRDGDKEHSIIYSNLTTLNTCSLSVIDICRKHGSVCCLSLIHTQNLSLTVGHVRTTVNLLVLLKSWYQFF